MIGTDGADSLTGSSSADTLDGRGGDDVLIGGDGADVLIGGANADTETGGAGDDNFVFSVGDGHDLITDFQAGGTEDRLQIYGFTTYQSPPSRAPIPWLPCRPRIQSC